MTQLPESKAIQAIKYINDTIAETQMVNIGPGTRPNMNLRQLDHRNDGFAFSAENVEDSPPGDPTLDEDTVYANSCRASTAVDFAWVCRPCIRIDDEGIVFNNAAIRTYALKNGMPLALLSTRDRTALRFYLGRERFPDKNAVNKFGFYTLQINTGGKKHAKRIDPITGETFVSPDWLWGKVTANRRAKYEDRPNYSVQANIFRKELLPFSGKAAPLYIDTRFQETAPDGMTKYTVLYVRFDDLKYLAGDLFKRTRGLFRDTIAARREFAYHK